MAATGTVLDARDVPRRRTLRSTLYDLYFRAEKIITPRLRSSQYAYYEALRAQLSPSKCWLDMGCGHQVFAEWMTREQDAVVGQSRMVAGIDLDWQGLRNHTAIDRRIFGDLSKLPFRSGSWDVISANMVMEHLEDPDAVLREVHRTLSPGGTFVFHTPNFYHWGTLVARALPDGIKKRLVRLFEGRVEADVFETHYRVNTAAEVGRRARAAGFEVLELRHVNSSATLKMLGPIVLLELLYIRLIEHPRLAQLRSGLVVTLRKP